MTEEVKKEEFIKVGDLIRTLNVSLPTAYRLLSSGQIGSHGFGGCIRIARSDLEEFIMRSKRRTEEGGL